MAANVTALPSPGRGERGPSSVAMIALPNVAGMRPSDFWLGLNFPVFRRDSAQLRRRAVRK